MAAIFNQEIWLNTTKIKDELYSYVPVNLFDEFKENMTYRLDARGSMAAHPHMEIPSFLYQKRE